ncbi:MAG: hypothetical protein JO340_02015 [Acidobacteriaceae bacterium]|nr:hypothetical protein [Acidobacteriaceae bacterium]
MAAELAGYIPAEDSQAVAALTEINAALSRLSSQAFSGASPISETECHFWTHSLLGIGVPILALVNITRFLHRTLAEARLVQRFNAFKKVGPEDWLGIANPSDPKWSQAHLEKAILDPTEKSKALTPTAPYFSGRDGFKATEYTISAPLGAISSCSSEKWTLRPLTHEAVHPVVGGILTAALPNTANRNEAERIIELLNDRRSARNQFESIQALLIHLFDDLDKGLHEDFSKGRDKTDQVWTLDEVSELIFRLKHEVEETMVHAFDYLYFFRGEPKAYVHSVWNSLDSIPSLSRKVPQFVMRTTAAISIPFLDRRRQPEAQAKSTMIALLKSIGARTGAEESYRSQALAYLSEEWTQRKQDELVARIWIANFVRAFLYLPTLDRQIAEIHRGPSRRLRSRTTAGAAATKVVYSHRPMHLDARDPITDPVGFAAFHARGKPEPAHSAWILTMLAFNAAQNHGPTS